MMGFPGGLYGKESACNAGGLGSIPGLGQSPGEGNDNSLQYSCLENPMDRGTWQATVHGVAKSQTWHNTFTLKIYGIEHLSYDYLDIYGISLFLYFLPICVFLSLLILIFLPALGHLAARELSLLVVSEGYSLVAVWRRLIAVTSLVAEHSLWACRL